MAMGKVNTLKGILFVEFFTFAYTAKGTNALFSVFKARISGQSSVLQMGTPILSVCIKMLSLQLFPTTSSRG